VEEKEQEWINWVDDHLVHILPANIYRTPTEALQSFEYISDQSNFTMVQKV
jgi:microsomal prostaglandin-E synthase 2